MDVAGELQEFFASFAGDVPFQHPQTVDHCVLHVGDSTARLATRHYWVTAPAVLDMAVKHFATKGFAVFGATAYSAPDLWTKKYGEVAPLEPRPLVLRSPRRRRLPLRRAAAGSHLRRLGGAGTPRRCSAWPRSRRRCPVRPGRGWGRRRDQPAPARASPLRLRRG